MRKFVLDSLIAGRTQFEIQSFLGISNRQLTKHYAAEIAAVGNKTGPAAHAPTKHTRAAVFNMVLAGASKPNIAAEIGISLTTLNNKYEAELTRGRDVANGNVTGALYQKAIKGDTLAMIFWLKTRAGFKEAGKDDTDKTDQAAAALRRIAERLPGG